MCPCNSDSWIVFLVSWILFLGYCYLVWNTVLTYYIFFHSRRDIQTDLTLSFQFLNESAIRVIHRICKIYRFKDNDFI